MQKLLVIEDVGSNLRLIQHHLRGSRLSADYRRVTGGGSIDFGIDDGGWDAVLFERSQLYEAFRDHLALVLARLPGVPVLLMTGSLGEEAARELRQLGVAEFVLKDRLDQLVPAIERSIAETREQRARHDSEPALRFSEDQYNACWPRSAKGFGIGVWKRTPSAMTTSSAACWASRTTTGPRRSRNCCRECIALNGMRFGDAFKPVSTGRALTAASTG